MGGEKTLRTCASASSKFSSYKFVAALSPQFCTPEENPKTFTPFCAFREAAPKPQLWNMLPHWHIRLSSNRLLPRPCDPYMEAGMHANGHARSAKQIMTLYGLHVNTNTSSADFVCRCSVAAQ